MLRVSVTPSFAGYILILCLLSGPVAAFGLVAALIVHETGHVLVARLIKEPIERIRLSPFGGVMLYKTGATPSKGIKGAALALAGPLFNYTCILLMSTIYQNDSSPVCKSIVIANLSMMLINLIPALPFDGGSVLFSVGYYLFDVSKLIGLLCIQGMLFGALFCMLACIGAVRHEVLNLSLIVVGVYVFIYARGCKRDLLAQNLYTVIHERMMKPRMVRQAMVYRLAGSEPVFSLLAYLCKAHVPVFMLEDSTGQIHLISDTVVCRALLDDPGMPVDQLSEKLSKSERKSE